jgi:hypothetical protein
MLVKHDLLKFLFFFHFLNTFFKDLFLASVTAQLILEVALRQLGSCAVACWFENENRAFGSSSGLASAATAQEIERAERLRSSLAQFASEERLGPHSSLV